MQGWFLGTMRGLRLEPMLEIRVPMRNETSGLFPAEGHGVCTDAYSLGRSPSKGEARSDPWADRSYPVALANTLLGPTPLVGTACPS